LNPPIGTFGAQKNIKNVIELKKLWPPKVEGVKNSKKKPLNAIKANSHTLLKIIICCFVAIRIQR
jgi:hypothetical protein